MCKPFKSEKESVKYVFRFKTRRGLIQYLNRNPYTIEFIQKLIKERERQRELLMKVRWLNGKSRKHSIYL
jgi:hypothetical protein